MAGLAENKDVPVKSKSPSRRVSKASSTPSSPIRMIVRRGAVKRYQDLKKKTAHLEVEVVWDQRDAERRQDPCLSDSERRRKERRGPPPFTWDAADFVVVTPKSPKPAAPRKPRKP
jgi:hypothetical protein